ncbi:DUF2975 domain-containing protein [Bacillus sp. AGMB 02131]|uniref:DUF2975 domain-containing protein n=1 Tax=Peribacillus faecalis TaxID=2772559 RepID=A0A927D225_9BACI|nr:DUF2975 domain-containing protein [Peribacillus faecalis]MBD3109619.1 DUF2975 domain-containing protein [Peribacillus faecalis]
MKRETLFLKAAVLLLGLPVLAFSVVALPMLMNNPVNPAYAHMLYPMVLILYITVIPYFIALYQAFQLLNYIDKNQAFSEVSVKALNKIKYCAITISALYIVMLPFTFFVADQDDAPGLILFGLFPIFASMVIAIFAAVLQKLLNNAIQIKSENDLTI